MSRAVDRRTGARRELQQRWYEEGFYGNQTLAEVLASGAQRHPTTLLTFESTQGRASVTLPEVLARAERFAAGLHRIGLRPGDVVAVQLPNRVETAVAYAAVARLGATVLPIVHTYGPVETGFVLRESGASALLVPDAWGSIDYTHHLREMGETPQLRHVIVVGNHMPTGAFSFAALAADEGSAPAAADVTAADRCLLLYTSGTTADPKGVQHSHNSLVTELRLSPTPPIVAGTVNLQPFPAGHIAGLTAVLSPFVHGYDTIMMDRWDAVRAAELIDEFGVTAMAGTPFHLATLLDACEARPGVCTTMRDVLTGGAGVPPALVERAERAGWKVARCYGSSEQPTVTASTSDDRLEHRAYTDGRPLPGAHVRIAHDGEVLVIGPDQFFGYTNPSLDEAAFTDDGWFCTGDVGRLDDDRLVITDRKKDIIIRGGQNISASEVEGVLARHEAVAEAVALAMPDDRYGERVCAVVVLRPGCQLNLDAVRAHFFAAGIARHKTPERLVIVDDLPRTPAGKVRKHELREQLH
jgi:acyl-CoA synthetase (AMP-forming)/AMP-acid ligase II